MPVAECLSTHGWDDCLLHVRLLLGAMSESSTGAKLPKRCSPCQAVDQNLDIQALIDKWKAVAMEKECWALCRRRLGPTGAAWD
jgi:hypothetical protein